MNFFSWMFSRKSYWLMGIIVFAFRISKDPYYSSFEFLNKGIFNIQLVIVLAVSFLMVMIPYFIIWLVIKKKYRK